MADLEGVVTALSEALRFYLSRGNLCHDKVLARYLTQQKRVPLSVFLEFNRVKEICGDQLSTALLQAAAQRLPNVHAESDYLSLEPELTTKELDLWKAEAELSTVYVEGLPGDCSREQLAGVFAQFGPIQYISLPKFAESKVVKGFAFVQFATSDSAQAALAADGTTPAQWEKPVRVLSRERWASFKPQFMSLRTRMESLLKN